MLELFVIVPSVFSGALLWIVVSRWVATREGSEEPVIEEEAQTEQTVVTPTVDALAMLDVFASRYDPPTSEFPGDCSQSAAGSSIVVDSSSKVKCNCGLEFPEDLMLEHAQSTGHSKPFDQATVKIAKIWDLEEAVIETASPDCVKCGKPVPGLKRIGKTIYVAHLGCANSGKEDGPSRKSVQAQKPAICSICWRPIATKTDGTKVESLAGQRLAFHDQCLKLESRSQLLFAENPRQRYRRTHKW